MGDLRVCQSAFQHLEDLALKFSQLPNIGKLRLSSKKINPIIRILTYFYHYH